MPLANVLIVDDDFDSAEALLIMLENAGYDARVALNAAGAVAIVSEDFEPDFAVIDIGLPEVSGLELVALLRTEHALDRCAFIAVSGYVFDGFPERSLAAGFAAHLRKPLDFARLLTAFGQDRAAMDRFAKSR